MRFARLCALAPLSAPAVLAAPYPDYVSDALEAVRSGGGGNASASISILIHSSSRSSFSSSSSSSSRNNAAGSGPFTTSDPNTAVAFLPTGISAFPTTSSVTMLFDKNNNTDGAALVTRSALLLSPRDRAARALLLAARDGKCSLPCGSICCGSGEECYKDGSGHFSCAKGGGPNVQTFTTTMVSTYTLSAEPSSKPAPPATATATVTGKCDTGDGYSPCGDKCCSPQEECVSPGTCKWAGSTPFPSSGPEPTSPARPTAGVTTVTSTMTSTGTRTKTSGTAAAATYTTAFIAPHSTSGSLILPETTSHKSHLSGGAIAGIVIGSVAGALLLGALLLCCCVRGAADVCADICGCGRRRSRRSDDGGGGGLFGLLNGRRQSRPDSDHHPFRHLLELGAALAAILLCVRHERRRHDEKSSTASYSSFAETSSPSQSSSKSRLTTSFSSLLLRPC